MRLRVRFALVVLLTVPILGAVGAGAQVPSVKGPGKKALQVIQLVQQDLPGQSDVDLYTVPVGTGAPNQALSVTLSGYLRKP